MHCYICHGGHSTPKVLVEHICVGIKNAAKGDVVFRDSKGGKLAFISPHVNQEMTNSEMPAFFPSASDFSLTGVKYVSEIHLSLRPWSRG